MLQSTPSMLSAAQIGFTAQPWNHAERELIASGSQVGKTPSMLSSAGCTTPLHLITEQGQLTLKRDSWTSSWRSVMVFISPLSRRATTMRCLGAQHLGSPLWGPSGESRALLMRVMTCWHRSESRWFQVIMASNVLQNSTGSKACCACCACC